MNTTSQPKDSKLDPISDYRQEVREQLRKQEAERRKASHERALGGPQAYRDLTFDTFDPALNGTHKLLQVMKAFDFRKMNLLLVGSQGVGKTHLATAVARQVLLDGGHARIFRGKELAVALRGRRSYATDYDEVDATEALCELDLIVIDDIERGPERAGYWASVTNLFDLRKLKDRHGMIVLSNRTIGELRALCGAPLADRLEGQFKHYVVPLDTRSARSILAERKNA